MSALAKKKTKRGEVSLALSVIPIARPSVGEPEIAAVRRVIESGWLTQGREVEAFERSFAELVGAPLGCAVSSCTTALHLALKAVGVGAGDEVITVSHSFIATANAVRYLSAIPVFVDIDPSTYNMDPRALARAITPRTKAVLCVHQLGMPCDISAILSVAKAHSLPVIEDAACAIGSRSLVDGRWEHVGKPHGDIVCFSFHPRKILTTGDGGMLVTASKDWDRKFRLWRQHGMSVTDLERHKAQGVVFEQYSELGYNYRMTDLQAAIGRSQLERLSGLLEERRTLAAGYLEALSGVEGLVLPSEPSYARTNWQSFPVRLAESVDRTKLMESLLAKGIHTRRGVMCAHLEPAFKLEPWKCEAMARGEDCEREACRHLPQSEAASARTLLLPLFPELGTEDQQRVVVELRESLLDVS